MGRPRACVRHFFFKQKKGRKKLRKKYFFPANITKKNKNTTWASLGALCTWATDKIGSHVQVFLFFEKQKEKLYNGNKNKIVHRHIIYKKFQKNIFYNFNIFLASNKILKNSNKAKSATAIVKPNKNHFKNTKINSNLFLSNFLM